MKYALIALGLSGLTACTTVGPDFQSPEIALSTRFAQTPDAVSVTAPAHDRWWQALQDPTLDRLVDHGLRQNLSIQAAVERVREAEIQLRAAGLTSLASGDFDASHTEFEVEGVDGDQSSSSLGISFVLDLFGGQKRREEQAAASLAATVANVGAARLAFQSSVVETYLTARFYQASMLLRERSIANRRRLVRLVQEKLDAGEETNVSLRRAEAELVLEEASLPELVLGFETSAYALATLLSAPGEQVLSELRSSYRGQPVPNKRPAPGVPADLLRNRPDVKAAEHQVAAAVAAVGVSESELYPSLQLDGSISVTSGADTWQIGPALNLPVFNRATLKASRDVALSQARQAELAWRQTVETAVEEVQANLSRTRNWSRQVTSLARATNKYRDAADLSREVFDLGSLTLIELVDTEDQLTQAALRLADARRNYTSAWAQLNVATGRGAGVGGPIAPDQGVPMTALVHKQDK